MPNQGLERQQAAQRTSAAPGHSEISPVRLSAQRSLARAIRRLIYAVLLTSGVAGLVAFGLGGPVWAAPVAFAAGAVAGLALAHLVAGAVAGLATRPIEICLAQPRIASDIGSEGLNCQSGRALSRADFESDLGMLDRHLQRAARRSHELMLELDNARVEANEQKVAESQFLAKMSHELRTPLNAILGYTMLLQEDAAEARNASAVEDLGRIELAGRNLLAVINDILDHARIEAGKTLVERGVIKVRELAEAAVASCPAEQRNGNTVDLVVADDIGIMVGDAARVRQCLLNLLSNAFKFTSNGKVTLSVARTLCGASPGIVFSVSDTGIGISAADLDDLFDAFSQIDDGPTRRFGGPGLGLAITRRLARMMGGDCTVESIEGVGSTFRLLLPLRLETTERIAGFRPDRSAHPLPLRRSDRSALVVDDDEAVIDLTRRWLERIGYDVFAAVDGETGLALAREHEPDLILLDASLPGISGYDVLVELRADPKLSRTPVVLITVEDNRAKGLAAGASEYLRKPIREEQLRAIAELYGSAATGDILVIDDDDDAAELISRSVEQLGFSTRRACDGVEGVEMASATPPAAIVLDLSMPRLDGFGVIERLSSDEKLMAIPLIVVSGCDISLNQHRALAAAGYRFFTKGSATPREIAQSLREMVA